MNPPQLLVLIVMHGAILREGFRLVVDGAGGLRVVASVSEPRAAVTALRRLRPNILLVDVALPNQMAFFLTRMVRRESPSTRVVVSSRDYGEALVQRAAEAGADAIILETIEADDLGAVLRTVGREGVDRAPTLLRTADLGAYGAPRTKVQASFQDFRIEDEAT
jgi:DNA-binding NarL/FixJ family response regulator